VYAAVGGDDPRADKFFDFVFAGELGAEFEARIDKFAVDPDVEDPATGRFEDQFVQARHVALQNNVHHTGGLFTIVSRGAELDLHAMEHVFLLFENPAAPMFPFSSSPPHTYSIAVTGWL
jgi:hypothetical protein